MFYKQNEIACILLFGVLEGIRGALRQSRFASCFKTKARINIRRLHVTFLALVHVGSEIEFRRRSDLQVAQNEFFQNRRNSTNIYLKINQHDKFLTFYNTSIFKISTGFSSKLKPHNSFNLALCRACLYEHFCLLNFTLKSPARINILTFLTTSTKPFCAIRVMFSLLWRAAFRCPISPLPMRLPSGPK